LPGLKIFYYFPPASWDRRRRYFTRLLDATDYIATPFPWNAALLAAQGASVRWVGHPAVDRIRPAEDKARAKQALGADPEATVLALLPGSRALERRLLGETFLRAAEYIRTRVRKLQVFWSAVPGSQRDDWLAGVGARRGWVKPVANSAAILQAADVGLCCFGTVTLEAALAGCPVVAAYRGTLAMALVFSVMRIPTEYYSLPNIAAGKRVLPEFVGRAATPEALGDAVLSLLRDVSARQAVEKAYAKLREQLGPPGAARRAAEMVVGALQGKLEPHRRALG
jgi:lipid-A-disaccharide synthase